MSNINQLLNTYKKRLVSVDSRNKSFFLSRLLSKEHIDLVKFFNEELHINQLKDNLISNNQIIINKISNNKDTELSINKFINNIYQISNEAKLIELESGRNDFSLGFPFIEGKFLNGKEFRGPFVIHKVKLIENKDSLIIELLEDDKIINPAFILSYLAESDRTIKTSEFSIPNDVNYLEYTYNFLNENGFLYEKSNNEYIEIESLTKTNYRKKYNFLEGEFNIINYVVLGLFKITNESIYNEIDYLEKNNEKINESTHKMFFGEKAFEDSSDIKLLEESKIKYISPIDWSQRAVIKASLEDDLIIEGPPGTGKSQTLVNLIINLILKNKKVLVVSEKIAAIDVIYNRLGSLKENALLIKNHITNKDDFYRQIRDSETYIKDHNKETLYNDIYDRMINQYIDNVQKLNNDKYYKNMSFKDVLNAYMIESNNEIYKSMDELRIIDDFLMSKDISPRQYLLNLLSIDNIGNYKIYENTIKQLKSISYDDFMYMFNNYKEEAPNTLNKINYFLYKLNKELINYVNTDYYEMDSSYKISSYNDFIIKTTELYNKINDHQDLFNELNKSIYEELLSLDHLKLVYNWNNLNTKERENIIKELNRNISKKGLRKLFSKNNPNKELYEYIYNYYDNFNIEEINQVLNNFDNNEFIIIKEFYSRKYHSLNDLQNLLLNSNVVTFADSKFDLLSKTFIKEIKTFDVGVSKLLENNNELALTIIKKYLDSKLDVEMFVTLLLKQLIDKKTFSDVNSTYNYMKSIDRNYINTLDSFEKKYLETLNYTNDFVKNTIKNAFRSNSTLYSEYTGLVSQANLKQLKPLKTVFETYFKPIKTMFPIILTTPDVVSAIIPIDEQFDYVIFDEASQMFIERAIPSINRGSRVIVAGDSKQLKPSSLFTQRINDVESEDMIDLSVKELEALDKESLLEMAKHKYRSRMLQFHYRSEKADLIGFSSTVFYDNKLLFSSKLGTSSNDRAIKVIDVEDGVWSKSNNNYEEAVKVVSLVKEILATRENKETIGIITFNVKQKELIQELLNNENDSNINNELYRVNERTKDDESLFVKNIENVQGDERDIIIFSIAYGENEEGLVRANFGSLNQIDGPNRLNVAITRAKKLIYIVKSLPSNRFRVNEDNRGPFLFRKYLEYAEYVSNGEDSNKQVLLNTLNNHQKLIDVYKNINNNKYHNEIGDLLKQIIKTDFVIKENEVIAGYNMDYTLYGNSNNYLLGIKLNGYRWNTTYDDNEKEIYLQQYLESRGYNIHHIVSVKWEYNREEEIKKLEKAINDLRRD